MPFVGEICGLAAYSAAIRGRADGGQRRLESRVEFGAVYKQVSCAVVMIRIDIGITLVREMNPPAY